MQVSNDLVSGNSLKQQVRDWMQQRQQAHTVPPTPEEIRRQLGWGLLVQPKRGEDR